MAYEIVSGNLNQWGDTGKFETDRSTWGFGDNAFFVATRGIHDIFNRPTGGGTRLCRLRSTFGVELSNPTIIKLSIGRFNAQAGKKYMYKAFVYVPTSTPVASDSAIITFSRFGDDTGTFINKTVLEAKGTWVEIQRVFDETLTSSKVIEIGVASTTSNGPESSITDGILHVDVLQIYEVVEVPDTPPICDLDIDEVATIVTNESAAGAGDGSIQVEVDGTGTYEYSKNDGANYQGSNLFAGLTTGVFIVKVRDTSISSCEDRHAFVVNHGAVTHDFTTHESVSGANDGAISFNVTGTGGPFEFTIDAGQTWHTGNNFASVAPGTYIVGVRNADGNIVIKTVTINAGTIQFDKVYHSKNPITFTKAAASGWEALTNYRLYNDVRVEDIADSGTYNSKLKVELTPDSQGMAVFYLREAFRDVFTFTPPTLNQNSIVRLTDRIKRFKNFSGELEDFETTPGTLTESLPNLVTYGGIDKFHYPNLNFFTDYLSDNKKFLTWAPVVKYVDLNQEDYLNFYVYGNFTTLKLRIKAYFDDATNETQVTKTLVGSAFSQLYQLPAGPVNSGASLINPAKNLLQYELTLLDQSDTAITETRTYYVDSVRHPLTRFILFLNSLGAFEVLRFTGQASIKTSIRKEVIQKFLPHNYSSLEGEFQVNNASLTRRTNYSSGHIKGRMAAEWHEYMQDLLLSPRVFDITDGRRIPIVLVDSDHEVEDQNYVRFQRTDAQQSFEDESFTPLSI